MIGSDCRLLFVVCPLQFLNDIVAFPCSAPRPSIPRPQGHEQAVSQYMVKAAVYLSS